MQVEIPETLLLKTGLTSADILLRLAVVLFSEERLTLGQASRLAGLHQMEFQAELARRRISLHYDEADLERDLRTLGLKA